MVNKQSSSKNGYFNQFLFLHLVKKPHQVLKESLKNSDLVDI